MVRGAGRVTELLAGVQVGCQARITSMLAVSGISIQGENDWAETGDWTDRSAKRIAPIATSRE